MKRHSFSLRGVLLFVMMAIASMSLYAKKTAFAFRSTESMTGYAFDMLQLDAEVGLGAVKVIKNSPYCPYAGTMVGDKYYMQVSDAEDETLFWGYFDFEENSFKEVCELAWSHQMKSLTYDAVNDKIYGYKGTAIYEINKTDGTTTKVFSHPKNNSFYALSVDGEGGFWAVTTLKQLNHINSQMQLEGDPVDLVYPDGYSGLMQSDMTFHEGVIYASLQVKTPSSPQFYSNVLATIDPVTAQITVIGSEFDDGNGWAQGLSFGEGTGTLPEEPEKVVLVKSVRNYGDVMGTTESETKRTDYFYGPKNQVLREITYQSDGGSLEPYRYKKYVYTDLPDGRTLQTSAERLKVAGGGSLSDTDRYWQDYRYDLGVCVYYNAEGLIVDKYVAGTDSTHYEYEGKNLVSTKTIYRTGGSKDNLCKNKVINSDFLEGWVDCPQTVINGSNTSTSSTIQKYEYNSLGLPIKCVTYAVTADKDDDQIYCVDPVQGASKSLDLWAYDDKGRLVEHIFYKTYKEDDESHTASYNNKRQVYTYTDNVAREDQYSGDGITPDGWAKSTNYSTTETAEFNGEANALKGFKVEKSEQGGAYLLTAEAPLTGNYEYQVYRDAQMIGLMQPNAETGLLEYLDENVVNGLHDWFVLTYDPMLDVAGNISDAVEVEVKMELQPVTEFEVQTSKEGTMYYADVTWKAPKTAGAEVLGYNIYCNVSEQYIDKATPWNEEILTEPSYRLEYSEEGIYEGHNTCDFWVEVVYDLGKKKSAKQTVTFEVEKTRVAATIADFKKFDNGYNVSLTLKKAKVTLLEVIEEEIPDDGGVNEVPTVVIEDESGAIMIDAAVYEELGDVFTGVGLELTGVLNGKVIKNGSLIAVGFNAFTDASSIVALEAEIKPTKMTIDEAASEVNKYRFVSFADSKLVYDDLTNVYTVEQGDQVIKVDDAFAKLPVDKDGFVIVPEKELSFISGLIMPDPKNTEGYVFQPYGTPVYEESTEDAIESVTVEDVRCADIYDLSGRLVKKAGSSISGLPAGLYIIGNRKVMVR